ncbi:histidine phosphatase family protein [Candidatus Nanohalovita haloferacivicina]|uniref:histidine phosphatase family protein n=1 Tax=Candidatus Nanohalovita haloferacivicina TaxID=2978046 RepID=UPI00325FA752|nr:hypothetical protein HBNXNv_0518 [Candidatus Nanohalobia archaeon BNXNv]
MEKVFFLRHFQTEVDPDTPVSEWNLSEEGLEEMEEFMQGDLPQVEAILTSPEPKAQNTAERLLEQIGEEVVPLEELREVDRSRRGFIEKHHKYVETAKEYLQNDYPKTAWEPKSEVKRRIREFIQRMEGMGYDRVLVVGHGLYFSIMLGEEPYYFWRELEFGELIEKDFEELQQFK